MLFAITLLLPLSVCLAAPTVTEDQLRSLIQPLLDGSSQQGTIKIPADAPPLFASLAAVAPLDNLIINPTDASAAIKDPSATSQQISPANQQLGQLNLAGGITNLVKTALGSLRPPTETAPAPVPAPLPPVDPLFGYNPAGTGGLHPNTIFNTYPNGAGAGGFQPLPAPAPATRVNNNNRNNMFNPLSLLFGGMGGGSGSPFGMFMPSLMMRMLEGLMELF